MASILETLRARAMKWLKTATMEELGSLPVEALELGSTVEVQKRRRMRVRKKMRTPLTRSQADEVRKEMSGLVGGTVEYRDKRNELALKFGASLRQIGCSLSGLDRAAKRHRRPGRPRKE